VEIFVMDRLPKEVVLTKYSTSYGELITGQSLEFGRLRMAKGTGSVEHTHEHEQVVYVMSGMLRVTAEGKVGELTPGMAFHVLPNIPHKVEALEDTQVISVKNTIDGVGHKV
jgi:quercetin dioxygenase-like cupin family protein